MGWRCIPAAKRIRSLSIFKLKYLLMSTYSMAQVSALTGISPHTMRIWERRYHFLKPNRTETNIRYFSDDELRMLLNISILLRGGIRVSQVDKMSEDEINKAVRTKLWEASDDNQDVIDSLTMSMLRMDEPGFSGLLDRQVSQEGLMNTMTDVIYPFLQQIGILWGTKSVIPSQEHFASNLIRQKIIAAIDALPDPPETAPRILICLLEEEDHEIGALLAAYIGKELGYRIYYLGQRVPLANLDHVIEIVQPTYFLTMFITIRPEYVASSIDELSRKLKTQILVSGAPENFSELTFSKQIRHIQNPAELASFLRQELDN